MKKVFIYLILLIFLTSICYSAEAADNMMALFAYKNMITSTILNETFGAKVEASLTGKDNNTTYLMSMMSGQICYFYVPIGQAYTMEVHAWDNDGIEEYEFKRELDIPASYFQGYTGKATAIGLREEDRIFPEPPPTMHKKILIENQNGPVANRKIIIHGKNYNFNTYSDKNGYAEVDLPILDSYTIGGVINLGSWDGGIEYTYAEVEAMDIIHIKVVDEKEPTPKPKMTVTLIMNTYVNGMQFDWAQRKTDKILEAGTKYIEYSPLCGHHEGIIDLVKTTRNGEEIPLTEEAVLRYTEQKDGDVITFNYYYEYNDLNHEYQMSVQHIFGNYAEIDLYNMKPGDTKTFYAQTSAAKPHIVKPETGYPLDEWVLTMVSLEGGQPLTVKGTYDTKSVDYVVPVTMIHEDTELNFYYGRIPVTPTPTPTPSPTPTITPTSTPTSAPTNTPKPTPSETPLIPTPTPTVTLQPTPTISPEPTPYETPTPTVTITPTITPTLKPTAIPSPTVMPTSTPIPLPPTRDNNQIGLEYALLGISLICAICTINKRTK